MSDLDRQTPAQHRARYFELMANAKARAGRPPPPPPALDGVASRETVPGGRYASMFLARGQALRLVATGGGNGVSMLFWNAHDTSERLNVGDTVKLQWTAAIGAGHVLFSDMGRVLASITAADAGVRCDLVAAGGRDAADKFRLVAGKHGMSVRDVPPCVSVFADVRTDGDGRLVWAGAAPVGSAIDFRAEMDLLVAVANCPHPLAPAAAPGPIEAIVWHAPPPTGDDPCRTAGEEAVRGFENTAAYLAQREALR